jgi:hypothetical protein
MAKGTVDFSKKLRAWDGFGINYVAAAQTRDWKTWPQDYGSFELLGEDDRQEIMELLFGEQGLQPTIGKMFIDSLQAGVSKPRSIDPDPLVLQPELYDHETTTKWMRYFWREGLKRIRARGEEPELVATLYGPAPWMTLQKRMRGRDLDQNEKYEAAKYMISFAKHMIEKENIPIRYLSLHNEGGVEEMRRWPDDGGDGPDYQRHDYNGIWPVSQVVDFIRFMRKMLDAQGLQNVGLGNGECTRLEGTAKYTATIAQDDEALANYALVTSHGFGGDDAAFTSRHLDPVRAKRPDFKGWVTSASWGKMDITFLTTIHRHIYTSKINGYIPWAVVQRHSQWTGGDPNPGTAILIDDDGKWSVQRGYYLFKHYCPVGRAGMAVAQASSDDESLMISAFSGAGTRYPDAAVVLNAGTEEQKVQLSLRGSGSEKFSQVVTDERRNYVPLEDVSGNSPTITVPAQGVVTLQGK